MNNKSEPERPNVGDLVKIINCLNTNPLGMPSDGLGVVVAVFPKSDSTNGYASVYFQAGGAKVSYFFRNILIIRKKEDSV